MPQVLAVIGAVTTVAGTVASYNAQRKVTKTAERQQKVATERSNRQSIREAQIRRAQALNSASQMGALTGSSISGGISSLNSQLGSGLGFSTQMTALSTEITKYQRRAQLWGDIANLGGMAYQQGGGFEGVKSFFSTINQKPTKFPLTQGMPNRSGGR